MRSLYVPSWSVVGPLLVLAITVSAFGSPGAGGAEGGQKVHLFILSGQSNMAGLNPDLSFTPTVTKALAPEKVIVVKDASSGQPIRRWHKKWKPGPGKTVAPGKAGHGDLYDRLMKKVAAAIGDVKPATVTFVWMQGERDAKEGHDDVYAKSLAALIEQFRTDLGRKDVNAVIGRLSDCLNGEKGWDEVRKAQVAVADADPRVAWIETDDLNGPRNGLHYAKEGYVEMGKRFAESALKLIKSPPSASTGKAKREGPTAADGEKE